MKKNSKPASKATLDQPFKIVQTYLIRTVTHYIAGRLRSVGKQELVLEDAAWIADTGRFSDAAKHGRLNEVEPVGGLVRVAIGSIVDAVEWTHALPTDKK